MCGIAAYIGRREALAILIAALKRLEYRGYDSAGVCILQEPPPPAEAGGGAGAAGAGAAAAELRVIKRLGRVARLEEAAAGAAAAPGSLGIGHTRWATHGAPSDRNAHPHTDALRSVAVVHNGIVENYTSLKRALELEGYVFVSETDTEVLAHLLADMRKKQPALSHEGVVRAALRLVTGAFGVAVVFADRPDLLIGARHGSPLLLGVGDGEFFLASDASAIVEHTSVVEYIGERELVSVTRAGYTITSLDDEGTGEAGGAAIGERAPRLERLELTLSAIEKGGFAHFMLKEINEQPAALRNAMRGRVLTETGEIRLGGLAGEPMRRLCAARRIIIAACGTSFHSGQVGEYLIETLARVPVEVEYASELRYRRPILRAGEDVLIAISQSGETADTLAAVREAKAQGVLTLGLVNVVGSSIARETDAGCYLHVGPEIGVASTKAFSAQVLLLAMIALAVARERGEVDAARARTLVAELAQLPDLVQRALDEAPRVLDVAREYRFATSFLFLGRGSNFPVALEGALKLKEISYIHAEGLPAAELKHGPLALVERFMPVVCICPRDDPVYDKLRANVEEVLARGGSVILVAQAGDDELAARCDAALRVPRGVPEWLAPLVHVVPLQLLAYHIAVARKCDVDRPRNLAKSVTVE